MAPLNEKTSLAHKSLTAIVLTLLVAVIAGMALLYCKIDRLEEGREMKAARNTTTDGAKNADTSKTPGQGQLQAEPTPTGTAQLRTVSMGENFTLKQGETARLSGVGEPVGPDGAVVGTLSLKRLAKVSDGSYEATLEVSMNGAGAPKVYVLGSRTSCRDGIELKKATATDATFFMAFDCGSAAEPTRNTALAPLPIVASHGTPFSLKVGQTAQIEGAGPASTGTITLKSITQKDGKYTALVTTYWKNDGQTTYSLTLTDGCKEGLNLESINATSASFFLGLGC